MPELPEVESLRLGLLRTVVGQKVMRVSVRASKLVSGKGNIRTASDKKAREFKRGLEGEKIVGIDRRAKNLIFKFSYDKIMLVHLKMTGQLVYIPNLKASNSKLKASRVIGGHPIEASEHSLPHKHTHIIFELQKGILYYNDTRTFGYLLYFPSEAVFLAGNHFEGIGLEPHDVNFTLQYFVAALGNRTGTLKKVLMDQRVVTGLGNIYADEVAFAAGVRPTRQVKTLKSKEIAAIYKTIQKIIPEAIRQGGSSVANYLLVDGSRGNYARQHKVYGKSGELCQSCRQALRTTNLNGRTTVFCPSCQQ